MPGRTQSPQEHNPRERENPDASGSRALNRLLVDALRGRLDLETYPMVRVPAGRWLLRGAERWPRLPLVVEGRVEVVYRLGGEGNQVIPAVFLDGEIAMMASLFSAMPLQADLVTAEDTLLRWIPAADLERCLLDSAELLVLLVRFLAQRLREVQRRERGWLERSVHLRVCAVLARVANDTPKETDGRWLIRATHEHLAARCGVSRPKLSQELKQMEQAGQLRLHRGSIEIVDQEAFARLL